VKAVPSTTNSLRICIQEQQSTMIIFNTVAIHAYCHEVFNEGFAQASTSSLAFLITKRQCCTMRQSQIITHVSDASKSGINIALLRAARRGSSVYAVSDDSTRSKASGLRLRLRQRRNKHDGREESSDASDDELHVGFLWL
jgi:hypothetical protein